MSVLIKGMEMPQRCKECDLFIEAACYAKGYRDYRSIMDMSKPADCPLIEVKTPHGRLGDLDELIEKYGEWYTEEGTESGYIGTMKSLLKGASTVIEAECET